MAGMTAKDRKSEQPRCAQMDATVEPAAFGQATGTSVDRVGRLAQTVHQDRAGNRVERGKPKRLGHVKHEKTRDGRAQNARNGTASKTATADALGPARIEVPRDRDASSHSRDREKTTAALE